ncbi:antirestriction protein ArdA [Pseudaquidulcibacter saccharophilus]|uniref:antirestriction protein ArdA n=1 Tax=Pseudaquidulcibacter saccharophilus TaxID=2831900 RepID=UPI001EFF046A|nr:antirestriction protein ArdA [Pseudaquidulcibacter saccharophilus]
MTTLFAQPYDFTANGFYFHNLDEYVTKSFNLNGPLIEEYEIQFIEGEGIDYKLFEALNITQCNIEAYFNAALNWDEGQKLKAIIAVGECAYKFDLSSDNPDDFDVDIYQFDTMRELAEQFVEDGLYGTIPQSLKYYIDYDAIARDLSMDYSEITIDGTRYIYRCA